MLLIGFIGRIGSGKTTCAKHIEQKHGFIRLSFAEPLKEMLVRSNILTRQDIENKTPFARQMMQKIGTDLIRNQIDPDFWVKKFVQRVHSLSENGHSRFVVDDVRFPNEADTVKRLGGLLVKIVRDTSEIDSHESESYVDDLPFDCVVSNNGSMELLLQQVDAIVCRLTKSTKTKK